MRFVSVLFLIAYSLFTYNANAQLCQGSLGVPIVNKTFGAGSNPGVSLAAATTTYQYVSSDCPPDGYYTVRNNTTACFGDSWHSITSDHTGDPNGYFMLVNASVQPSAFYIDTVKGLCSGTTFEFASWIMNVLKPTACSPNPIMPNLTFTIEKTDGTVIQSYSSGNIAMQNNPTWQQFGFFFTTPIGITDIVLRIFNNAPGGCGNDLALDDITFRPCGPLLTPSLLGHPDNIDTLCEGQSASYTFSSTVSSGFNNPLFQWQESYNGAAFTDIPGATSTSYTRNFLSTAATGTYTYRLSAAEAGNMSSPTCRVVSTLLTVKVEKNPVTSITANSPVCERSDLFLTASGGNQFTWNGPAGFLSTATSPTINGVQLAQAGKYFVLVTNSMGCSTPDSINIVVNPSPTASTSFSTTNLCTGDTVQLQASGGATYLWSPVSDLNASNISNPRAYPVLTTMYKVIVSNNFNCLDSAEVEIVAIEKPLADAGPDKITVAGLPVQLTGTASGQNISFFWTPGQFLNDPLLLQPLSSPLNEIEYTLHVVSADGCGTATDIVKVFFYNDIFIPTAFTPNGDGLNDTWDIPALAAYPNFELSVFNRYGEIVFHASKTPKPWDGRFKGLEQPNDVFIYMLKLNEPSRPGILKGFVQIIR